MSGTLAAQDGKKLCHRAHRRHPGSSPTRQRTGAEVTAAKAAKERRKAARATRPQIRSSRKLTALDRADVRFIRPNVQIYDAHVADLYQWVCAQYLVGVKGAETVCWRSLGESNPCFSLEGAAS